MLRIKTIKRISNPILGFSTALLLPFLLTFITGCGHSTSVESEGKSSNEGTSVSSEAYIDKSTNRIVRGQKKNPLSSNNASGTTGSSVQIFRGKKPLFDWPVWEARMTRGYLPRGTKRRRRPHKGIDLAAPRGTAVMSAHDGIVIYTGKGFKGYGKLIMIETAGESAGFATLYAHLDKIVVFEGQKVRQGEVIGALGNTGRSSGPHLHFEIRKLDGPIDPLPFLPAGDALTNDVDDPSAPEE